MSQQAHKTQREPWWELRLHVPTAVCDDLSALLIEEGAMGVQTIDAQAPVHHPPQGHASLGPRAQAVGRSLVVAESAEAWARTVPQDKLAHGVLVASYAGTLSRSEVLALAGETLDQLGERAALSDAKLISRCDDAWAHAWKQHFKPQKLGRRIWVVPSWEKKFVPPVGSVALHLDPGMAFGTGQHATTSLCMRAVERELDALAPAARRAARMLDVGCGSGILAMTALALGMGHADAIDMDPLAEAATLENLDRMGWSARARVSLTPVAELQETYPLVTANILAPTLITMAAPLAARVAHGGLLVLSGILVEQAEQVLNVFIGQRAHAKEAPLALYERLQHEGWVALVLARGR